MRQTLKKKTFSSHVKVLLKLKFFLNKRKSV